LVDLFGIPSAFIAERFQSVTHSFGIRKLSDGSESTLPEEFQSHIPGLIEKLIVVWIHFLAILPELPFDQKSRWVKSALVLKSSPTPPPSNQPIPEPIRQVTLICFQPLPGLWLAINRLFKSDCWEDVLKDPYLLINASLEAWHELIDESAWKLLDLSRQAEIVRYYSFRFVCEKFFVSNDNGQRTFEYSAKLDTNDFQQIPIDYNGIHNLAKDAIHMVEGLDAVLRSVECALSYHREIEKHDSVIWTATHNALQYRKEMFHSTRLRMVSVEQRLKNVVNMVGHPSSSSFDYILKTLGFQHWNLA
jgi:hypothetical protein